MSKVSGTSTGNELFSPKKRKAAQLKRFKKYQTYYTFNSDSDLKPTPEQIANKKKREEKEAILQARWEEKRHRGGYRKTKKGRKK